MFFSLLKLSIFSSFFSISRPISKSIFWRCKFQYQYQNQYFESVVFNIIININMSKILCHVWHKVRQILVDKGAKVNLCTPRHQLQQSFEHCRRIRIPWSLRDPGWSICRFWWGKARSHHKKMAQLSFHIYCKIVYTI